MIDFIESGREFQCLINEELRKVDVLQTIHWKV